MEYTIRGEVLREALLAVKRTISKDETRPHLAGAMIELGEAGLTAVTTDGHRLSKYQAGWVSAQAMGDNAPAWSGLVGALIASGDVEAILRALPRAKRDLTGLFCHVAILETEATFRIARGEQTGTTIVARIVDAKFPPYDQVIPHIDASPFVGVGVSPRYLADAAAAAADMGADGGLMFRAAGPLDPMRVDCTSELGGALTVVIMPMRMGGPVESAWESATAQWKRGAESDPRPLAKAA